MGAFISTIIGQQGISENLNRGEKRGLDEVIETTISSPKRRKLNTTSQYIYKMLFKAGEDSDVTLVALGRNWHLHRLYLRQSPYFDSMFTGNWKESNDSVLHMTISDDNITAEALEITLGSLYCDELNISDQEVVGVLAAAVLLQLDALIQYCSALMIDAISPQTLLHYYHVAHRYGVSEVESLCIRWLDRCLLIQMTEDSSSLRTVPQLMLQATLGSPHLFVIETEFSTYVLLKMWLFLQLHPDFAGNKKATVTESHRYFKERQDERCFLDCDEGYQYRTLFWQLRLVYIAQHYLDMEMVATDRILPLNWLQPAIARQWYNMLRTGQRKDVGPSALPEPVFERECARSGRVLRSPDSQIWRWTGYNFGLDLVFHFTNGRLIVKRNMWPGDTSPNSEPRKIMIRMRTVSLNSQQQDSYCQDTGIKSITLSHLDKEVLLETDPHLQYPLLLNANLLVFTPSDTPPFVHKNQVLCRSNSAAPPPPLQGIPCLKPSTSSVSVAVGTEEGTGVCNMRSNEVHDSLVSNGYNLMRNRYSRYNSYIENIGEVHRRSPDDSFETSSDDEEEGEEEVEEDERLDVEQIHQPPLVPAEVEHEVFIPDDISETSEHDSDNYDL